MWICTNQAFLSCVAHRNDPTKLLVRARMKGHIEAVFPDAEVFTDPEADYFYRAEILKPVVANVIANQISDIDYDNFKNSVSDDDLHGAYEDFWYVMHRLQGLDLKKQARKRPTLRVSKREV